MLDRDVMGTEEEVMHSPLLGRDIEISDFFVGDEDRKENVISSFGKVDLGREIEPVEKVGKGGKGPKESCRSNVSIMDYIFKFCCLTTE